MLKLGEKIRTLRKQKNISQEVLAGSLGVSFQAVSKWETGAAMPDVTLIPAIACFFGVSTDELFDFNLYETEQKVMEICKAAWACRDDDPEKAESILREGLKRYPGNDIILNNLLCVIPYPERAGELIDLCRAVIEATKCDDVRYDAWRIMAEAYKSIGEYGLCREAVEKIPEIYFTKLNVAAELFEGEDMFEPAVRQRGLDFEGLIRMSELLADYYLKKGEKDKAAVHIRIAIAVMDAVKDDFPTQYTRSLHEWTGEWRTKLEEKLAETKA
ncbi:MAG: helix-turn-helix transcriptional regulator [Clostridia bacterium]|nr:helix-turn-helix transcriptional regulator [Clostridia bacterium]